ncbi:hypothetical protein [Pseudidiomarina marina]
MNSQHKAIQQLQAITPGLTPSNDNFVALLVTSLVLIVFSEFVLK